MVRLNQLAPDGGGVRMPCASACSISRLAVSFISFRGGGDGDGEESLCEGELGDRGTWWAERVDGFDGGGLTGPGLRPILGLRCWRAPRGISAGFCEGVDWVEEGGVERKRVWMRIWDW